MFIQDVESAIAHARRGGQFVEQLRDKAIKALHKEQEELLLHYQAAALVAELRSATEKARKDLAAKEKAVAKAQKAAADARATRISAEEDARTMSKIEKATRGQAPPTEEERTTARVEAAEALGDENMALERLRGARVELSDVAKYADQARTALQALSQFEERPETPLWDSLLDKRE